MDKPRPCGCKGCRTCLVCEENYGIPSRTPHLQKDNSYVYCPYCNKAWPGWNFDDYKTHPNHSGIPIEYPGIFIDLDFLNNEEETALVDGMDAMPWDLSQSGRRKQNFGPKCNFKKNKLKLGDFEGFPKFTQFVQEKFKNVPILKNFHTIEQCSLEYDPKKGASIDPHIDDCWIWGERIVTVNLLADSVLTMTYNDKPDRYNLHWVEKYPLVLNKDLHLNTTPDYYRISKFDVEKVYPIVRIPMPRKSLLVIFNEARYDWEHQVLREDIITRRLCLAYREFTPPYLLNGSRFTEGEEILVKAKRFWDQL